MAAIGDYQMRNSKTAYIAITAMAALTAATPAAAAIVVNGGFQANTGTPPTGWTVTPGGEIVATAAGAYIPCCGVTGTSAQLANRIAAFGGGNVANISTLDQMISTVLGRKYVMTFDYGAFGNGSQTLTAKVFSGSALLASLSPTKIADNNLGSTFSNYSLNFTGGAAPMKISFGVDGFTNNVDGVLDNVAVSAIPEPSTWAMMIGGFGIVGTAMRRRRRMNVSFG
jgi:hypothetical protein